MAVNSILVLLLAAVGIVVGYAIYARRIDQNIVQPNAEKATPARMYMDGVDFTGSHLHLITDDHSGGGHLLDCIVSNATIEIDQTSRFNLVLP